MKQFILNLCILSTLWINVSGQFNQIAQYNIANTIGPGIPDQLVLELTITEDNTLIASTFMGGIGLYKDSNWETVDISDGLPSNQVYFAEEGQLNEIWIGTNEGLVIKTGEEIVWLPQPQVPTCGLAYDTGEVWIGSNSEGLFHFSIDGLWTQYEVDDGMVSNSINCLYKDDMDQIWIGTSDGVSVFDGQNFTNFTTENGLTQNRIYHIAQDEDGKLWFANFNQGADIYDGQNWTYMQIRSVRDFYYDEGDTLWVAGSKTIFYYKDQQLTEYLESYTLPVEGTSFTSFTKDRGGKKFIGTYHYGLLAENEDGSLESMQPDLGLISNNINFILEGQDNRFWFGGRRGISIFDDGSFFPYTYKNPFENENLSYLLQLKSGLVWVTDGDNIYEFDGLNYTTRPDITEVVDKYIRCIYEDDQGMLWFGTYEGLYSYDGSEFNHYTTANGLHSNELSHIVQDASGDLWVTGDEGISKFDGISFTALQAGENGFTNGQINDCLVSSTGSIWVSSRSGLSRFDGQNWHTFTISNSNIFSNWNYGIAEDANGHVWFANTYGIDRYEGGDNFTHFDSDEDLGFPIGCQELFFDSGGNLWIGTFEYGIYQFDMSSTKNENLESGLLQFYPNPVRDVLFITLPEHLNLLEVRMINESGQLVKKISGFDHDQLVIPTGSLQSGMYVLQLRSEDHIYVHKCIVINDH